jgi:uncharacterized protein YidB (DUF937 family)
MGLMDILNGMQNGPRGAPTPTPPGQKGHMSPMMMALLGLLAYKALKSGGIIGGGQTKPAAPSAPTPPANQGGSLGDILGGLFGGNSPGQSPGGLNLPGGLAGGAAGGALGSILGGLLGGGNNAGNALNGGLRNLLQDMEDNGQGDAAKSWVGTGANQSVSPKDLANALGADDIDAVAKQTGMSRDQVLAELSQHLPDFINQLTPNGRVPTDQEAAHW